jgi:hypothetical protein
MISVCVGIMYSGEYDVCDVTLSLHPHLSDFHRGQANFSACPVWMHTQSNITNIVKEYVGTLIRYTLLLHQLQPEQTPGAGCSKLG